MAQAILVEKNGRRGIALGPEGRFFAVRVPVDVQIGEALPEVSTAGWRTPLWASAASLLLLGGLAIFLLTPDHDRYTLVTLRYEGGALAAAQPCLQMTLALDRRGKVTAVRLWQEGTEKLVGMRVEQAIHHTVGRFTGLEGEDLDIDVQVRPYRHSTERETADLQARIRTALPSRQPPIEVVIGPPADEKEIVRGRRTRIHKERR